MIAGTGVGWLCRGEEEYSGYGVGTQNCASNRPGCGPVGFFLLRYSLYENICSIIPQQNMTAYFRGLIQVFRIKKTLALSSKFFA
jgi:hypothetical protein